jgi:transposase-like protein
LESRTDDDTQVTQRKYRCHSCHKFFYVLAKTQFHYDDAETLVYTMRLKYGKLPSVVAKKLAGQMSSRACP